MAEKKLKSETDKSLRTLDKRVMDRLVQNGTLARPDVEAYMKGLPDVADKADNIADKVYGEQS